MICAPSEVDSGTYFFFRPLITGGYKEVKFMVTRKIVSAFSDKINANEMQWIRDNIMTGIFDLEQETLKEKNHV